jgi:aerobic-type carbon monoxide dehydrogenase small subunit (CoxS/CutS family)
MANSDRVTFTCDGVPVDVVLEPRASLLDVLRDSLGHHSVKDGCAPQGQCGCCTVLVDGDARVACVTPAARVAGRSVTTLDGLDAEVRTRLAEAFVATGGSQCGFCTPGIVVRAASALAHGRDLGATADRVLAAHLCRCTGWQTIREAFTSATATEPPPPDGLEGSATNGVVEPSNAAEGGRRDLAAAAERAELEGGVGQEVAARVALGAGGFADDTAPADALVAVPLPPGSDGPSVEAASRRWVVGESLLEARSAAGKVQGRRTTRAPEPPLSPPPVPEGGVALATGWVEPAYLEPDASWCEPGGEPASPLANGGAFGGKATSLAPDAARALAGELGRAVRVVFSREDVVRLGPKRPPIAATAVVRGARLEIGGVVVGDEQPGLGAVIPYALEGVDETWTSAKVAGPSTSARLRAWPLAERTVLLEGALAAAGIDRSALAVDDRVRRVLLDACALEPTSGAAAGARVGVDASARSVVDVDVRVAAGDPLDEVTLRSYCIGAAHMALGWVLSEGLTVDADTGEVLDLTIRSFGILRAQDMPRVTVTIVDDPGEPRAAASDAAFAAVAAATWNAITAASGLRPTRFPARDWMRPSP